MNLAREKFKEKKLKMDGGIQEEGEYEKYNPSSYQHGESL